MERSTLLLSIVRDTVVALQHRAPESVALTLDSSLDTDLGLDSLARVELLARIERAFGVALAEDVLANARTPRHLLVAIGHAVALPARTAAPGANVAAPPREWHGAPAEAETLLDVLEWHVTRHGDRVHLRVLAGEAEQAITYAELSRNASRVAAGLRERGIGRAQTVALMLPTSPDYFAAFLGAAMAGAIPVPIYPPARAEQIEEHVKRHAAILANAEVAMLVSSAETRAAAHLLRAHLPAGSPVVTSAALMESRAAAVRPSVAASDIAFIQYTSGSTGDPKGVVLTHANLLANIRAMAEAVDASARDVFVSWLPLYHDMGLIGAWLGGLYVGFPLVVMSPLAFLARPSRWLRAIGRYRGTLSAAPNFAYELCAKRVTDTELEGLDLSSWRLAFNGAEAVSPDTIARFTRRFEPCGFNATAMTPVYGLAEASVGLAFPPLGRGPLIDTIERDALMRDGKAVPAAPDAPAALRFVSCGRPIPGHRLRIVDDGGREVGERIEGRLEFSGPSATAGYYRNPQATARLLDGEWRDTGDRAYAADAELYVTGRVKDIVIRAGRHIYPDEVEAAVGALDGVRKGCVAVFGTRDAARGTERLVVLAETRDSDRESRARLHGAIRAAVTALIGEPPDEVVLAPPHTVLKTSSGKLRRAASRALYESGRVGTRGRGPLAQVAALAAQALSIRAHRGVRRGAELAYGLYAAALLVALGTATWLATACLRDRGRAWRLGGFAARLFFGTVRIPLTLDGADNLPPGAAVLVANHSSYLDGVALIAALPRPYRFVAKRELEPQIVAGVYLRRIGAVFVERFEAKHSVEDAQRLTALAAAGESLGFFPEGTLRRAAGLMPFHLGAFRAAAHAGVPVVPVAIRGTRSILPDGAWLPRRGAISVTICEPIAAEPDSDRFADAVRLRDAARAAILDCCDEGDAP